MRCLVLLLALLSTLPAAVAISGPAVVRGQVGAPFVCAIVASGGAPLAYASTALPDGLTLNPATGRISGTPTTVGVTAVTVTVTGTDSATAVVSFDIDPAAVPSPANAAALAVSADSACAFQCTASATGATWVVAGAPAGIAIDAAGLLSGTPTAPGIYNLDLSADAGGSATTLVLDVLPAQAGAPDFATPSPAPVAAEGVPFACFVAASGAEGWDCSDLPAWLTLDPASGLMSGTPPAGAGPANLRLTAFGAGATAATTMFAIPVAVPGAGDPLPVAPAVIEATEGCALAWRATADVAATWSATGLPAGLVLTSATGLLAGAPAVSGDLTATITATPAGPLAPVTTSIALRIRAAEAGAPVIGALVPPVLTVGAPAAIALPLSGGAATSFGAGAIAPFAIDGAGIVSGTPDTAGEVHLQVSASNAAGTAVTTIVARVGARDAAGPLPTTPVLFRTTVGAPFAAALAADLPVTAWSASGLPAGLTLTPFPGHLTGSATAAGDANVFLSAADADAANPTHGVVRVVAATAGAPLIAAAGPWFVGAGQPLRLQLTADQDAVWTVAGLPAGLSADATGLISGSTTVEGAHVLAITAGAGAASTLTAALLVVETAVAGTPVFTDAGVLAGTVGVPFSATLAASAGAYDFAVDPQPGWMTVVPATGALSGTPLVAGSSILQVSASNAAGTSRSLVVLRIAPAPAPPPPPPPPPPAPVGGLSSGGCGAGGGLAGLLVLALLLGLRRRAQAL